MVVGTVATVAVIATGGAALAPMTTAGASVGGSLGAVGVGTSAGAIAGAGAAVGGAGSVAGGAVAGGVAGGTVAAGVGGSGIGLGALAATAGTGGLGLLAVGVSVNHDGDEVTFDCWKPVVHDTSQERSKGMLLKDLVVHPCVANVTMAKGEFDDLPSIMIENIWNEWFEIEYVLLRKSGKIACHAKPLHV